MEQNNERALEASLQHALKEQLGLIADDTGWKPLWEVYRVAKSRAGSAAIAQQLGLQTPELDAFEAAWRGRIQHDGEDKEGRIALYRLLSWGESIAAHADGFPFTTGSSSEDDQVLALKRVRAVELILRSLILETHAGNDALLTYLNTRIPADVLQRWAKAAEKGNILSGTTFSELASLFITKEEFPQFEKIFSDDAYLRLLRTKRETIREYLDDIRRLRNAIAHHKQLTDVQTELLDLYYQDLVTPIQSAKDKGAIKTDPKRFLDISKEELTAYFNAVREDIQAVRDDVVQLRGEVREGFSDLKSTAARSEEKIDDIGRTIKVGWLSRKMVIAYAGIAVAVVVALFMYQHYAHRPFAATIHVHGPKGSTDLMLKNKGKVILKAADFQAESPINKDGMAVFAQLPSDVLESTVVLDVEAEGEAYLPIDATKQYGLTRDAQIDFPVMLHGMDHLKGMVRNSATGQPIPNATVRIKTTTVLTDSSGRFDLHLPLELQEPFQNVEVTCPGYAYWINNQTPMQGDEEMPVLLDPSK